MAKRIFSLLLALCLTLALLPGVLPQAEAAGALRQVSANTRASLPFTAEEFEVIRLTNKERMAEGLHPVTTFTQLQNACDIRAEELVELFSHTRPDGTLCWTALDEAGLQYEEIIANGGVGENIAAGQINPQAVVTAWMNSEGHRANILHERFIHMGAGHYYQAGTQYYNHWVQMFVTYFGETYTSATVYVPEGEEVGTGIDEMYMYVVLSSSVYGDCYLPVSSEFVTNYDPGRAGTQTIGLEFLGFSGTVEITLSNQNFTPEAPKVTISGNSTTGKPKLSWNAVPGADFYRIYRATSKTGSYTYQKSTRSTDFTDTTAKVGTNYYYKVRAVVEATEKLSPYSNIVNRVCDLAKPVVSQSVNTTTGKPVVKWETVDGAVKYQIYRATSKDGKYELVKTAITARSYTDTTAKAGTNYYYKVKAIHSKEAANSAYSAVVNRVCDLAKPVVSIKLTTDGDPRVTWDKIDGAEKYYVYRAESKDGEYTKIKTTKTVFGYTDTTAEAGTKYYYKVKAIHSKEAANSAYSSVKYITAK